MAGLTKCVRPPRPCLPSKFLFDVDAHLSLGFNLSAFIAKHIEQPGSLHSKPASIKILSNPSFSAWSLTKPEPGTTELHAQYRDYDNRIQDFAVNLANDSYAPLNVVDVSQGFEDIGNPNSLYQEDELHLSLEGYEYWNQWLVQVSNDSECIIWQSQECQVSIE